VEFTPPKWGPQGELVWVDIPGFEGRYQVSSTGDVRSFTRKGPGDFKNTQPRMRKPDVTKLGYREITLFLPGGQRVRKRISRLVLESFVGPCPEGHEASHKDGNSMNDSLSNLAWKTHLENIHDKYEHGTMYYGKRNDRRSRKDVNV